MLDMWKAVTPIIFISYFYLCGSFTVHGELQSTFLGDPKLTCGYSGKEYSLVSVNVFIILIDLIFFPFS